MDYVPMVVENIYEVTKCTIYMGAQECPFQNREKDSGYHGYEYGDRDVTITNIRTGKAIEFNTLLIHMIRCHHFFESPKSSHRLNPKDVIELFDLKPGMDYSPKYQYYYLWSMNSSGNCGPSLTDADLKLIKQMALKSYSQKTEQVDLIAFLFSSTSSLGRRGSQKYM